MKLSRKTLHALIPTITTFYDLYFLVYRYNQWKFKIMKTEIGNSLSCYHPDDKLIC